MHIDLTFAQLIFSRPKSLRQINTKRKKANANQSVCNIFGGEYNCISLSFQRKKCFLRWNEEWSQRNDEWQEHLEKPHCCKEKDNIFVQSFYLCFWCFCVQFNLAKLFELKPTTIIFLNTKFDVSEARTWKGMGFRSQKCNKILKLIKKNVDLRVSNALLEFFFEISNLKICIESNLHIWKHKITWGIAL